ncbi:MAG TPA: hypothetical protein VK034_23800, partial [Enhygromyxa sp.]|nr:hypothetical protein [Enhygromyxa sp.]
LTVVALVGSASVAHAHPETATPQPAHPALATFDGAVAPGLQHVSQNPKKKIKLPSKKKKQLPGEIKVKDEPEGEKQKIPIPSSSSAADLTNYKNSRDLLETKNEPAKSARDSIKGAGETNNKADAITGVPIPANLDPLRLKIIERARGELGKVDVKPAKPIQVYIPWALETVKLKGGIDRLAEYSAVAYGSNAGAWANKDSLRKLVEWGNKHTTWCGIFALWAVKMGAGVAASNYEDDWNTVLGSYGVLQTIVDLLAPNFLPQPPGYLPDKYTYIGLQWGPDGIYRYIEDPSPFDMTETKEVMDANGVTKTIDGEVRHKLSPTPIVNWLKTKKSVPPIKPGDIGYTQEPSFDSNGVRLKDPTNHHYIIERVLEVDGKYIYFTIEGNYWSLSSQKDQAVVRNFRVYDPNYKHEIAPQFGGRRYIEAWYDTDELARFKHNRHMEKPELQP